ncbi:hypothetical protein LSAT2_018066 [Lamellibrachia satsuma]|nr:hypothetical protein LSAT2_018066 [Lamellibrachia satsuma]
MNSIELAFLLLLASVTIWADMNGEVDGIKYNKECTEGCKEVHMLCLKPCEGATNDDCENTCEIMFRHCLKICIGPEECSCH